MIVLKIVGIDRAVGVRVIEATDVTVIARGFVGDARFAEMANASGLTIDPSELTAYIEYNKSNRLGIPSTVANFKIYVNGVLMVDSENV